jgi:drug/metabolite transporter (DMT)-like permease
MSKNFRPYLLLHFLVFLVSFTGIFGKAISLQEGVLIWYRLFLSVIFLSIYIRLFVKTTPIKPAYKWKATLVGILYCVHWLFWYGSIKYANVSIAMSTISTVAVFNALIEPLINKRKFKAIELLLACLASIGMILIFQAKSGSAFGTILGIISALIVALASIFNKDLTENNDPYRLTQWEFASALGFLTLIMPIYLQFNKGIALFPTTNEVYMLFVFVIVCTLTPFIMNLYVLRKVSSFTSNLAFNMEPVWGIAAAMILFKEQKELNTQFYLGLLLILSSVLIYTAIKYYQTINATKAIHEKIND